MYKIITHTIKEEHFDHPMTAEYALSNRGDLHKGPQARLGDELFTTVTSMRLRQTTRTLFETYLLELRSELVGLLNGSEDISVVAEKLFSTILEIGNVVRPYYGSIPADQLSSNLKALTVAIIDYATATKAGTSTADSEARAAIQITNLSNLLSGANPWWPAAAVTDYFTKFTKAETDQIVARKAKNWSADLTALDAARTILLSGLDNNTLSLAGLISIGIISQFPNKFVSVGL